MTSWVYDECANSCDENIQMVVSEDEIRDTFYPTWRKKMWKLGRGRLATWKNCLDDWVTVHWAWRAY